MQPQRLYVLLLAVWAIAAPAAARDIPVASPERAGMSAERLDRITEITQGYVDEGQLAGAITMVARHGKLVHFEAVGARGADDARPLQKDALFRIYSMSKPITAVSPPSNSSIEAEAGVASYDACSLPPSMKRSRSAVWASICSARAVFVTATVHNVTVIAAEINVPFFICSTPF